MIENGFYYTWDVPQHLFRSQTIFGCQSTWSLHHVSYNLCTKAYFFLRRRHLFHSFVHLFGCLHRFLVLLLVFFFTFWNNWSPYAFTHSKKKWDKRRVNFWHEYKHERPSSFSLTFWFCTRRSKRPFFLLVFRHDDMQFGGTHVFNVECTKFKNYFLFENHIFLKCNRCLVHMGQLDVSVPSMNSVKFQYRCGICWENASERREWRKTWTCGQCIVRSVIFSAEILELGWCHNMWSFFEFTPRFVISALPDSCLDWSEQKSLI